MGSTMLLVPGEVRIVARRGDLEQARQVLVDFREAILILTG